jgi:hypothetical protein
MKTHMISSEHANDAIPAHFDTQLLLEPLCEGFSAFFDFLQGHRFSSGSIDHYRLIGLGEWTAAMTIVKDQVREDNVVVDMSYLEIPMGLKNHGADGGGADAK